jgi:hypothetical protein
MTRAKTRHRSAANYSVATCAAAEALCSPKHNRYITFHYLCRADNNPNTQSVPYFAGLMAIWSVLFLEHWKRTEKNTAMKWGTIGFEQGEVERPQFVGEY